jgi:hypothetical protein
VHTRIRSGCDRVRDLGLAALALACVLAPIGCDNGSSGGGGGDMVVSSFNLDGVRSTFLNEPLVFTFSNDVDPASVTNQTIQLRYDATLLDRNGDGVPDDPGNSNAIPEGTFEVSGNVVRFLPKLPSRPNNSDTGIPPSYVVSLGMPPMPTVVGAVSVFIPGFPATDTVRTTNGRPLAASYRSTFTPVTVASPSNVPATAFIDPVPGTPPQLQAVIAPTTTTNVPVDTCVQVRFSEPLLPSTVTPDSIFITAVAPNSGQVVPVPSQPFLTQESTTSLVTLYVGGRNQCGPNANVPLAGNVSYVINYTNELRGFGPSNAVQVVGPFPSFTTVPTAAGGDSFVETFDTTAHRDAVLSGAQWNPMNNPGRLVATAGGTGEDGPLTPTGNVTINTDTRPGDPNDPANPPGTFNWSNINIPANVTVTIVGHNPLRGRAASIVIDGTIDASGVSALDLSQTDPTVPTTGGAGGPGAGRGGDGGMDTLTPGAPGPEDGMNGVTGNLDGVTGGGHGSIGFVAAMTANQDAGGGGGGSYGTIGHPGVPEGVTGPGGGAGDSTYGIPSLDPDLGLLLGGAGGGGAGFSVRLQGTPAVRVGQAGTGGGGGGGVVELISGTDITVETRSTDQTVRVAAIRSNGGAGGNIASGLFAAGGGGGTGGGILLRAVNNVAIVTVAGRSSTFTSVQARGGAGGTIAASTTAPGAGGAGGLGRINFQANGVVSLAGPTGATISDPLEFNWNQAMPNRPDPWVTSGNYSFGTSTWIDTHHLFPHYTFNQATDTIDDSALFATPEFPVTRIVRYEFQGASEDPLNMGAADPNAVRPTDGHFTQNISEIDDSRFVRFRVVLFTPPDVSNPNPGSVPTVDQIGFSYTFN